MQYCICCTEPIAKCSRPTSPPSSHMWQELVRLTESWRGVTKKEGARCFHRHVTVSTLPSPSFTFPHLCIFLMSREIILSWRRDIASCMLHGWCDCFATSSYCARGCSGHGGHVQGAALGIQHCWVTNRWRPSKINASFRQNYVVIKSPRCDFHEAVCYSHRR